MTDKDRREITRMRGAGMAECQENQSDPVGMVAAQS